jgi:TP901 family phage tail tape measure protein
VDRNLRIRMLLEAGDRVTRPLRDITGASGKAAQALKATRDRLKEIDRAQANVAGFRQLKAGLRSTEQELTKAKSKVAALARAMGETSAPTKAMARDFARARAEAQRLDQQHQRGTQQLQQLRDRLRAAGIATNDLARHERELRRDAEGANRELAEQERRLRQATDRARRFGAARENFGRVQGMAGGMAASGAASIGTGIAMAAPIVGAVQAAEQYESTMTDIGQKADLTRRQSAAMGVQLLKAAQAANQLPDALQAGVDTLSGFGLDPRKAVEMMKPIGRAATAYKAEIADLSSAAFAANDNLKVPIAQTQRVIDIMAQAGKSGAFEIKDMAQYFPTLTAGYQALGQKGTGAVADLAAALQIARKGAGDSATAATNVANVLQKISSPSTIKAFDKMGVDLPNALKRMYAEGKTPLEAIAELTNKTLKGDLSKIGFLFEDAQVQQGLRPLIQNMEEYRRIRTQAAGATGVTDRDFADRMKDSAERTKELTIRAQALKVSLGSQLLPTLNDGKAKLSDFAGRLTAISERHPMLTKAVMMGGVAFAGLFLVLGGGAIVIAGLVAPFAALTFAATALGIGMLPLIATVAGVTLGIVAIGAAIYLLYANAGKLPGWFAGVWAGVRNAASSTFAWFATLPTRFAEFGRNMISGLIRGVLGMLGQLKSTIVNAATSAAGWFKQKLRIHSPSRVFAGFGGFMMAGLADGIHAGAAEPIRNLDALTSKMERSMVVGSSLPGFGMAGPGGSAAPAAQRGTGGQAPAQPIVIQIYGAIGQSEDELAQRVAEKLERMMAGARRTSSYADRADYGDA